jgi:putative flippase GtrA
MRQFRLVRFGIVAPSCALLHLGLLASLVRLGVSKTVANGLGFGLSAQVNFALSALFTWKDRPLRWARHTRSKRRARGYAWSLRWAKFNSVAVGALLINEVVFVALTRDGVPLLVASSAGIVTGAIFNFTVNHYLTFGERTVPPNQSPKVAVERRPALDELRMRMRHEGVAFFLPAFNEAANLCLLLPRIVDYFRALSCPFTIVIVNDGSTRDDTYEVVEDLVQAYPAWVRAVHHEQNRGYGAALRSGIRAALDTGHSLIGFCDADDQYDIESFGTLLAALQDKDAHLAVGYRVARADPLKRRVMGRAWHWLASLVLGFTTARDVDCGFKLFTRAMLDDIAPRLRGAYAAVSPELLARAASAGYRTAEAGLMHKPRTRGRQTGSDLKVVIMSLAHLFQLRLILRKERRNGSRDLVPATVAS